MSKEGVAEDLRPETEASALARAWPYAPLPLLFGMTLQGVLNIYHKKEL